MTAGWRGHQWPWRAPAALMEIKGALKRGGNGRGVKGMDVSGASIAP
jgi:hypothetical protein